MNDEIQFGEVEEASPQKTLRPDRNKHFAVAPYGTPAEGELPIFLDMDVAHDMEMHAQSDKSDAGREWRTRRPGSALLELP